MALVKATELGFYGGLLRYPGDEFDNQGENLKWAEVVEATLPTEAPTVPADPLAFLDEKSASELIAYAEANGLDIGGLVPRSGKVKILAAVKAAINPQWEEQHEPVGQYA